MILLVLVRFPWWYGLYPQDLLSVMADHWGRLLSEGFIPYLDIRSDLGPLSALVYYLVDLVPTDSLRVQRITALALLGYQAIAFNSMVAAFRMHKELSNFAAFAYVVLGWVVLHGAYLSPTLIGLSFLMPALGRLSSVLAGKQSEDTYFSIGFFFALAMLAELRISILLLCLLWVLLAFSDANGKKIGILLIGNLFPFLMLFVLASFFDANAYMWKYLWGSLLDFNLKEKLSYFPDWKALLPPAFVMLVALLFNQGIRGLSVNQQKFKNLFLSWFLFCLIGLLLFNDALSDGYYLVLLPAGSFYLAHFWLLVKSKTLLMPVNIVLVLQVLLINGRPLGAFLPFSQNPWEILVSEPNTPMDEFLEGEEAPVWIVGAKESQAKGSIFPGLYLESSIREEEFQNRKSHSGLLRINQAFQRQAPLILLDSTGVVEELFEHLPDLQKRYKKEGDFLYRRMD